MAFSPILKVAPENYDARGNIVGVNGCIGMLTILGPRGRNTKISHVFVFDIKFIFLHFFPFPVTCAPCKQENTRENIVKKYCEADAGKFARLYLRFSLNF